MRAYHDGEYIRITHDNIEIRVDEDTAIDWSHDLHRLASESKGRVVFTVPGIRLELSCSEAKRLACDLFVEAGGVPAADELDTVVWQNETAWIMTG